MVGKISEEIEVKVPASEAWKVYGSLQLPKITVEGLLNQFSKYEVLQGDGSAGTIIQVFFPPGEAGPKWFKEKFTVVDEERRVKEAELVEGGFLDLGFTRYGVRLEVVEKEGKKEESVVRATVEYELKEEAAANASLVSNEPLLTIIKLAADYVTKNYKASN
ncbi:hypothetical protein Salat_0777700 [Sesamum alatum]|uniref:Bet v I/Major latex protein domain-containing protein n=1 Tax=Sesamum alatum TaxID=300844 RepID=A0AAE1YSY7_9LAMI|nr:hypothetical protein Salat_0777700 [Sesamum alatum]